MDGYCFPQSRFDRALDPGMMQGGMFATEMDAPFRAMITVRAITIAAPGRIKQRRRPQTRHHATSRRRQLRIPD